MARQMARRLLAVGGLLIGIGCGDDIEAPTTGTLEITTTTGGTDPDPDGYAVSVDDGAEAALGINATVQRADLEPGDHSVRLTGIAANCVLDGANLRTVSIPAGGTAHVGFHITCTVASGSLEITTATSGPSPDPDGYVIWLDGKYRVRLDVNGAATFSSIPAGGHLVGLSGISANCQIEGDNPRSASITVGSTTAVAFALSCSTAPDDAGSLRITISTSGGNPDPNGYTFAVDDGTTQPIPINAISTLANVAAGVHTVHLSGVAVNCTVQEGSARSVTVTSGGMADATFIVLCPREAA